MANMENFKALLKPTSERTPFHTGIWRRAFGIGIILLKDSLQVPSWMAIGAIINTALYFIIGRAAFLVPVTWLVARMLDTALKMAGVINNPYMKNAILTKYSAQIPKEDGTFGSEPASDQICVFLIGARCNHPLGILAPGYKTVGDYFDRMRESLEHNAALYGCLGASDWIRNGERATNNEIMTVMYFRIAEGLHAFAHSSTHREAWEWYIRTINSHPHIAIWHETYVAPKGHWETIYMNERPLLFGAAQFPVKTESGTKWVSPVVDAMNGRLRTKWGRMGKGDGAENEKYGYEESFMRESGLTDEACEKEWLPKAMANVENAA